MALLDIETLSFAPFASCPQRGSERINAAKKRKLKVSGVGFMNINYYFYC